MSDQEVRLLIREFKGLWIPASIIERTELTAVEKMLWADIDSFTGKEATWFKSRDTVAREFGVSDRTISRGLNKLVDLGLVRMTSNDGRTRHYVSSLPGQSVQSDAPKPTGQTRQDVPIENNRENKKRKQFSMPHREEVVEYFESNGSTVTEAEKYLDYYTANGWKQGRGKPIRDWKAAARNWMRNEKQWRNEKRGFDPNGFTPDGIGSFIANG